MAVAPIHRAAGLRSLIVSSYQSVSGAGQKGVRELAEQVEKLHGMEEELAHPDPDSLPVGDVFGKTIAYNVVAKIDVFDEETGYTFEEIKMMREARRILSLPQLDISATCVRVPVPVGHSVSVYATFDRPVSVAEARDVIAKAPGVQLRDDPANGVYPSPLEAAGIDDVLVGRIRRPEWPRRRAVALRVRRQPAEGRRAERRADRRIGPRASVAKNDHRTIRKNALMSSTNSSGSWCAA